MVGAFCGKAARVVVEIWSREEAFIRRVCPRCDAGRRFVSSGKFRVNAQGKKIDVWLVYRCDHCDERWNRPIHERRPVAAFDPVELDALMRNDIETATRFARAAPGSGVGEAAALGSTLVHCAVVEPATDQTATAEIEIAVRDHAAIRLDRVLAGILAVHRGELQALEAAQAIAVLPVAKKALRRPAGNGQVVRIDLAVPSSAVARLRIGLSLKGKRVLTL